MARRTAQTYLVEERLTALRPVPLIAQPDAVMLTRKGELVVLNTKFRSNLKVSWGDRIQLTVEAMVLRGSDDKRLAGLKVAPHGYLRIVKHGVATYRRVELLRDRAIIQLWLLRYCVEAGHFSGDAYRKVSG
jgi:hypothetical protein